MATHLVPSLDALAAERHIARVRSMQASSWLNEEVAQRMLSRLDWMTQQPKRWLHWEPTWGGLNAHRLLTDKLPTATTVTGGYSSSARQFAAKPTGPSWAFWRSAEPLWEPGAKPVDMVWANMSLHLQTDPMELFALWKQALQPQGYVMFSALGPDTLREVRQAYAAMGWADAMHDFTDMHDWGDMLVEAGFAEPVMDMETLTLTYPNAERLIKDLRDYGGNTSRARFGQLRGKAWRAELCRSLEAQLPRTADGQLQVTVELIYGHAVKPDGTVPASATTHVALSDMQAMLQQSKGAPPKSNK